MDSVRDCQKSMFERKIKVKYVLHNKQIMSYKEVEFTFKEMCVWTEDNSRQEFIDDLTEGGLADMALSEVYGKDGTVLASIKRK